MGETRHLWKGQFADKYDGSIISITRGANEEEALTQMKVDRELEAAVSKHGPAVVPQTYEEQFYDNVDQQKRRIAAEL